MIKIFSKEGCPYCDLAKDLLMKHGYTYEEVRVDLDPEARQFLIDNGHRTVPQIYVGDTILVEGGYDGLSKLTTKQIALKIREINEQ